MKNGLLIWNIVLTIAVGYLLFARFGSAKKADGTVTKSATKETSAVTAPFKIAYFEMDSVDNNFQVVKDAKAEINKKEDEMNGEMNNRARNIQQRYIYFENQARSGTMTPEQRESAQNELKRLDDEMKTRKQQLDQEYNEFVARKLNNIKTKIENFLSEYNKDRRYSYIIAFEQGLFYYKDSAYNITSDVIRGLNDMYKNQKD